MALKDQPEYESMSSTDSQGSTRSQSVNPSSSQAVKSFGSKTMSTNNSFATKVVTGKIRGSYINLFVPRLSQNAKPTDTPKYGMTILIPKSDTATVAKIRAAQEAAIDAKWPNKRPALIGSTLNDGDGARPSSGEPFGPECAGHWVMAVSSKFLPKVIGMDKNEILDPSEVCSGDFFKVSINFYAYDQSGKRGTSAGLNNVLFMEKGESLGGSSRAEDDFADDFSKAA